MERLEAKQVKGHTYYYYSKWAWVDNRCRRVWQKYLGKLEDIVAAVQGGGPAPICAEVFQWGLSQALWQEATRAELVEHIDRHWPKRRQGLTTGQYLAIAAINRAISPRSKRSMWDWFCQTVLRRHLPAASPAALNSQRFWDHMDAVKPEAATAIWKDLIKVVVQREGIDLSAICYDGTNFYTFLDTFNTRCSLAVRGKNKQGRDNLRQFSLVLERFHQFFRELAGGATVVPETTLIFDKGNNSADNFRLLDSLKLKFVGSVKQNEHPELAQVPHSDRRFVVCTSPGLKGAKAFRVTKTVAGSERVLVVTYNPNLAKTQWMTLQNDVAKASKRLSELQGRLAGRAAGLIKGGKRPTLASVEQKCRSILRRQHLKDAIQVTIEGDPKGHPQLRPTVGRTAGSGDPRRTKSGDLRRTSTRHSSLATRHLSLVRAGSPDPPVLCDRRSPSHRPSARHLETFGRQNGGVGRPSPNETNSQRKQPGSEGGQDQLCSMPEGGSTEDFASINRGPPDHDRRARVSMDRSIFLVRVVASLA